MTTFTSDVIDATNVYSVYAENVDNCPLPAFALHSDFKTFWKRPIQVITTTYGTLDHAAQSISTDETIEYDDTNMDHIQPVARSITNSDNKVQRTEYSYPFTYTAQSGIKSDLLVDNRILPAWQTINKVDAVQVDGQRTLFGQVQSNGNVTANNTYNANLQTVPRDIERYEWDGVAPSGSWKNQYNITMYDPLVMRPAKAYAEGWAANSDHLYTWSPQGQLLTYGFLDFTRTYTYHNDHYLLEKITEIDGTSNTYDYDGLLRLNLIERRDINNVVSSHNTYIYDFNTASKPFVELTEHYPKYGSAQTLLTRKTRTFVDGLGRPVQILKLQQAPDNIDHVAISTTYDQLGRPENIYEPVQVSGNDDYKTIQGSWDYTETSYEPSPLNRQIGVKSPQWYWKYSSLGTNSSNEVNGYAANSLSKVITTDENGDQDITYTDKIGRTILTRRQSASGTEVNDTYSFYDDKNRIIKIEPPGSAGFPTLQYSYTYYADDLVKSKKIPDQAIQQFRYNDRDLLAYRQDGNMQAAGQWYGTIYDPYGREVQEGFSTATPETHNSYDEATISDILINNTYGTSGINLDKLIYTDAKIMLNNDVIFRSFVYDPLGRSLSQASNSTVDITNPSAYQMSYTYDDADNVLTMDESVFNNGDPMTLACRYDYDHIGRQTEEYNQVDNHTEEQISATAYTAKDQIKTLSLGGPLGTSLQQVDYTYLPNQFLSSINDVSALGTDVFALALNYDNNAISPQKNGNIASMSWSTAHATNQAYEFSYDYLNRLTTADFSGIVNGRYDSDYTYDERGNMLTLDRIGYDGSTSGLIDQLNFTIPTGQNRITQISDQSTSPSHKSQGYKAYTTGTMTYDANGNMNHDPGRDADIIYNHLDLPESITIPDSNALVKYHYGADGVLYKKETIRGGQLSTDRQYVGMFEYVDGVVDQIIIPTGFIKINDIPNAFRNPGN